MPRPDIDYGADGPAALSRARREEHADVRGQGKRVRYEDACLLDRLYVAKLISSRQYDIGLWLRMLWFDAGLSPHAKVCFMPRIGGEDDETDRRRWNARCYDETMRDLRPHSAVLQAVCLYDMVKPIKATRAALTALAEHRGIVG